MEILSNSPLVFFVSFVDELGHAAVTSLNQHQTNSASFPFVEGRHMQTVPVSRVIDRTDPAGNRIYNMTVEQARERLADGDVSGIDGEFALVAQAGKTVRLARTIGRLFRYFIAKYDDGPILIVADRIDTIRHELEALGLADQFHPSYA